MTQHTPRDFTPVMFQTWRHLLFAHWPIDREIMNALLPKPLRAHTFDGEAWVAVVPFLMTDVRLRGLPPVPLTHRLQELNVRTYVILDDEPGVYFFSLDASNLLEVEIARVWFRLNYFHAGMTMYHYGGTIHYSSRREDPRAKPGTLAARYRPSGPAERSEPGSLVHWLTERYALYAADGRGGVWRGRISHPQWPLQPADAEFPVNDVAQSHGLPLPDTAPLLHYAESINIQAGAIQRIR